MSFLFGWTKYFTQNTSDNDTNEHVSHSKTLKNKVDGAEEEQKYLDTQFSDDDDEGSSPDSLGGSFETLEEEIAFLRQQNAKLQSKYKYHKSQHQLLRNNYKRFVGVYPPSSLSLSLFVSLYLFVVSILFVHLHFL